MSKKFRNHHFLKIFQEWEQSATPLDLHLRNYFKKNNAIGSHDRKFLSETVYGIIRWQALIDYLCCGDCSWQKRYEVFETFSPETYFDDEGIPLHIRCSFPQKYFHLLMESLGREKAISFCQQSNYPAPITVRVNAIKIARDQLVERWKELYEVALGKHSDYAVHFPRRINFFGLPEFKEGYFEVQDEASQLVSFLIQARPGDQVLDYCSGSGGKTLAFAPFMQHQGQIYLHDIRSHVLLEAKKRLKRAGIQNAQILPFEDKKKKNLQGKMDWVLADVPCSGSGTLRRNPDMKWKFDPTAFSSLLIKQREIFSEALKYVKPKGHIVYSTCSILPQENEHQLDYFLSEYPLRLVGTPFASFPLHGSMDGFYAVALQKI